MKKKGLIIVVSILGGLIAIILMLCWTLFGLSDVTVNLKTSTTLFSTAESKTEIVSSGGFGYGVCVLFYNKDQAIKRIEKQNPYVKVVNIETVFPNKFIIHIAEREETFAVKLNEESYAICDEDLKILKVESIFESTRHNAILLDNLLLSDQIYTVGDFITLTKSDDLIKEISPALKRNQRPVIYQKALFEEMELYYNPLHETELRISMFDGTHIRIHEPEQVLAKKLQVMFASLEEVTDPATTELYIYILNNSVQCNITTT